VTSHVTAPYKLSFYYYSYYSSSSYYYSVCDPLRDIISLAVFEAAIRLKSTHLVKSCLKSWKKENMEIKVISYINPHLKYCLQNSQLKVS